MFSPMPPEETVNRRTVVVSSQDIMNKGCPGCGRTRRPEPAVNVAFRHVGKNLVCTGGFDIKRVQISFDDCQKVCSDDERCASFTYFQHSDCEQCVLTNNKCAQTTSDTGCPGVANTY